MKQDSDFAKNDSCYMHMPKSLLLSCSNGLFSLCFAWNQQTSLQRFVVVSIPTSHFPPEYRIIVMFVVVPWYVFLGRIVCCEPFDAAKLP